MLYCGQTVIRLHFPQISIKCREATCYTGILQTKIVQSLIRNLAAGNRPSYNRKRRKDYWRQQSKSSRFAKKDKMAVYWQLLQQEIAELSTQSTDQFSMSWASWQQIFGITFTLRFSSIS